MFIYREVRMDRIFWSGKFWGKEVREDFQEVGIRDWKYIKYKIIIVCVIWV